MVRRLTGGAALGLAVLLGAALGVGAAPRVELELWEFPRISSEAAPSDRYAWMRALLAEYHRLHPEVRVRLTELTWKAGGEKLRIALFAGQPPDVVSGALDPALVASGAVDPIDGHLEAGDRAAYLPGALESFEVGGATMAWPWCRTGDLLYLNLEALEAAGVTPPVEGRWTHEEWRRACGRLAAARADGLGAYPLGLALVPGKSAELALLLRPDMALVDAAGGFAFQGPQAAASIARLARWRREGWIPPSSPGWSAKDLWLAFTRDRSVAMAPFGLWAAQALERQGGMRWGVAALPPGEGGESLKPMVSVGYFVLRRPGRTVAQRAAAHELARFLAGPAGQAYLERYGQLPALRGTVPGHGHGWMARAGALLEDSRRLPAHPAWERLDEALKRRVQDCLLSGAAPEAAVAELEAQAGELLAAPRSQGPAPWWFRGLVLCLGLLGLGAAAGLVRGLAGEGLAPLLLAAPALVLLGLFLLVPAVQGFMLAFRKVSPGAGLFEGWVGLDNFRRTWSDEGFRVGCANTLLYAAVVVPGNLATGLVLAALIHPLAQRARAVMRGAFYLPGVCSVVAMAIVWRQILDERVGLLNRVLAACPGLGWLVKGLLPCLARVPLALAVVVAVGVVATLWARRPGGAQEPSRRRVERDVVLVAAAALGLLWVLTGFTAPHGVSDPVPWLTSGELSFWSVLLMVLVRGPGGALLVYLAALEAVDPQLYEAAEVDGAGPLSRLYHVTLPCLVPTTFFLAVTGVIDSFQAFGPVFLLTDGGPGFSSTVVVHRMFLAAFRDLDFGLAAAQGALLFLVVALVGAAQASGRD